MEKMQIRIINKKLMNFFISILKINFGAKSFIKMHKLNIYKGKENVPYKYKINLKNTLCPINIAEIMMNKTGLFLIKSLYFKNNIIKVM